MSKIILDVRSGDDNSSSSSLALRKVDSSYDGSNLRGRESYSIGGDLGDILYIASGDGELGIESRDVSFTYLSSEGNLHYYATGLRDGYISDIVDDLGVSLRLLYGGTVVESGRSDLSIGVANVGVGFWWTRNDIERERYYWSGGSWSLLGGGSGERVGFVGDDLSRVSFEGTLVIGGSSYEIGGSSLPVLNDGEAIPDGVEGVIYTPSAELVVVGHLGEEVIYLRSKGIEGSGLVEGSGSYLSPCPSALELPLLRDGDRGYMEVRRVLDFSSEVESGVVELLSDGRVKFGDLNDGLYYDGLVLGHVGIGSGFDLGTSIGVLDIPVDSVPDGSGLEPSGVANSFEINGSGLVWSYQSSRYWLKVGDSLLECLFVKELPKRLDRGYGYILGRKLYLNRSWSGLVSEFGHKLYGGSVGCVPFRVCSQLSSKNWSVSTGSFSLTNGDVVNFTTEGVSGSDGVEFVGGHILVKEGYELSYPTTEVARQTLRSIGLVPGDNLGLYLELLGSTVKGYELYDSESVGVVPDSSYQQFLNFKPRLDLAGYSDGVFYRVGDKYLQSGVDYESNDLGFEWLGSGRLKGDVRESVSRIPLSFGVVEGSTSFTLKKDLGDSFEQQTLTEGLDYDVREGGVRFKNVLGSQICKGYSLTNLGLGNYSLQGDSSLVREGDFIYWNKIYVKVEAVLGNGEFSFSSDSLTSGEGIWICNRGYREGIEGEETPDLTRLSGECLKEFKPGDDVEAYKVFSSLVLDEVKDLGSKLYLRSGESQCSLVVLREENIEKTPFYYYDVDDLHIQAGSYYLRIAGVEYRNGVSVGNFRFRENSGEFIFEEWDGTSWSISDWVDTDVILVREPRQNLTGVAEVSLSGDDLSSPFVSFDSFLVEIRGLIVNYSSGSISFKEPLASNLTIEVLYTDSVGDLVAETLIFYVSLEEATRSSSKLYTFNSLGREVELDVSETVYVNNERYLSSRYIFTGTQITFKEALEEGSVVKVSYGVKSTLGGEQAIRLSGSIITSKFVANKGSQTIKTPIDLTGDLEAGDLIKLGFEWFEVSSLTSTSITTTVAAKSEIEASSLYLLSVPEITYSGTGYRNAFLPLVGIELSSTPKSSEIQIKGDFLSYFSQNHLIRVEGVFYEVFQSLLSEDGNTIVTIEGFSFGHGFTSDQSSFLVSYRPIVKEGLTTLALSTGVISEYDYRLVKYDHVKGLGYDLSEGKDYRIDFESGLISLLTQEVSVDVSYYFLHTALSALNPINLYGGRTSYPSYTIDYKSSEVPSNLAGLGLEVRCYTYAPDTFSIRVVDEDVYAAEIAATLKRRVQVSNGNGAKRTLNEQVTYGRSIGLYDVLAEDVVARSRILLYHGYVSPLEDLISTSTGKVVGEKDGSFKFDLLQAGQWGGAGLEDPITREIQPRYIFQELIYPLNSDLYPTPSDLILVGDTTPTVDLLKDLVDKQKHLISNEMDDYVLTSWSKSLDFDYSLPYPHVKYGYKPLYKQTYQPSSLSRLYPSNTKIQTITVPGDLYADRDGSSTNGFPIAFTENLSMGQISNTVSLTLRKRPARFRVISYSSNGFPDINISSKNKPTFFVSAVPFDDFPYLNTGLPDTTRFISEGGDIPDIIVGNPDFVYQGLEVGSCLSLNVGGKMYPILNVSQEASLPTVFNISISAQPRLAKVHSLLSGCLVVLEGSASTLEVNGVKLSDSEIRMGDTLSENIDKDLDSDASLKYYQVGSDVGLKYDTGEIFDITLPSFSDPSFPWKEIREQNVPNPLTPLEGDLGFVYSSIEPFIYPALEGLDVNDAGDYSLPYLKTLSEREVLAEAQKLIPRVLLQADNDGTLEYVYPDDIRDNEASISSGYLKTSQDFSNLNGVAEQSPRQGDLVLIKPSAGFSCTGVSELALIEGSDISFPHFQSPTNANSFSLTNLVVELASDTTNGVTIRERLIYNPFNPQWDVSRTELLFSNYNNIDIILNKIVSDGGVFTLKLHDYYSPDEVFQIVLSYDGGWFINTVSKTGTVVIAQNTTVLGYTANSITIQQFPIPNVLTPAEEVNWPSNASWETWLFNSVALSHFWGAFLGYRIFTAQGSERVTELVLGGSYPLLYLDYRIDVEFGLSESNYVESNRLDFTSDFNFNTMFYVNTTEQTLLAAGIGQSPLKVVSEFEILSSGMFVKEESGVATYLAESDINTNNKMGYGPYLMNSGFLFVESAHTIRFKSLYNRTKTNQHVSIFVGSEVSEDGNILYSSSARYGKYTPSLSSYSSHEGLIRDITEDLGSLENVQVGDLLYMSKGHSTGTHRVKAVELQDTSGSFSETLGESNLLGVVFPTVVSASYDQVTSELTLETDVEDLSLYFNGSGYREIVVLLNESYLIAPESQVLGVFDPVFSQSALRVSYSILSGSSFIITEDPSYLDGSVLNLSDLPALIGTAGQTIAAPHKMRFDVLKTGIVSSSHIVDISGTFDISLKVAGGIEDTDSSLSKNTQDLEVDYLYFLRAFFNNNWTSPFSSIEDVAGNDYGEAFITPQDIITVDISSYRGIYLDPSLSQLWRDYRGTSPVLLEGTLTQVKSLSDYSTTGNAGWTCYEEVSFTVRRLRRFSDLFARLSTALTGFRFLYEERYGVVDAVAQIGNMVSLTSVADYFDYIGQGTNIGLFTDTVNLGDLVYCYDESDNQTLLFRVSEVNVAYLKGKVISGDISDNHTRFKVEVRTPLIPELQSFNKFVAHGFEEVYSTAAVSGISVDQVNDLSDTNVDFNSLLSSDFIDQYYLVIDPQGLLAGSVDEYGQPPKGDDSQGNPGVPSSLDDNRGVYKINGFTANTLTVEFYAGEASPEETFLPLISGVSSNDLRVTSGIQNGTYTTSSDSIHPFSYKIYKRNSYLDDSLAALVLFFRERTLSWVDKIEVFNSLPLKTQTWALYYIEELIEYVGTEDKTHPSNDLLINTLLGDGAFPFSDDMLSVPDRRLMIEDPQMVNEGHTLVSGMPSLLEDGISTMGAREKRNTWISIRTNRLEGTLQKLSQVDLSNPNLEALEDVNEQ